jgi:hypothetical protein
MPKIGRDYSKYKKDGRPTGSIERAQSTQPEQGFFESLSGERVQVELTSGTHIEGILRADLYNKYDIELETEEELYLIRKDVLGVVKYCKGERKK